MGGTYYREADYQDEEKDIQAIKKAFELAITRFDTAEVYAEGYSEEILGKGIKGIDRKKLFISSKVPAHKLSYDDVMKSFEASLRRLDLDYLDLYLLHRPNLDIPFSDTMKAFDQLKEEGLIKNIGVCNSSMETLRKLQQTTDNKIVLNQVHYNLIFREPVVDGLLDYCQNNDIFLEAWRPIQKGCLTRKGINIVDQLGEKYDKTPSQIALNWLISQQNVITLVKTSNIKHLEENLGSLGWQMEDKDIELLKNEYPIRLERSNSVRLV